MYNLKNKYGIITPEAFTNIFLQKLIYIAIHNLWVDTDILRFYTLVQNTQTLKYCKCEQLLSFLLVVIQLRTRMGKYVMQLCEHSQGHDFLLCKQIQQT